MPAKSKTVYVGLSGGVDSSVSAALLKQQGYNVVGVFIRTWQPEFIECTWRDERRDAIRVAAHLDIPFRELDLEREYKKYVADYMIAEYRRGRTPNPDIMCNREIKFGAFAKWAIKQGADYIVTGHYAQNKMRKSGYEMEMGKDKNKDQTYFLWTLTQKDLGRILFPIGHLEKKDVRVLAKKFGLPTAAKKDSQGICMLGAVDTKDFLKEFIKTKKGKVLSEEGITIGTHDGALLYTIGERHGLTITNKKFIGKPYFVVAKNIKLNTLVVSANIETSVATQTRNEIKLERVNWIGGEPLLNRIIMARSRYRAELHPCMVVAQTKNATTVAFVKPEVAASSGQSLVFYDKKICLGGGIIT